MRRAKSDAALIAKRRCGIDTWESRATGATSSITGRGAIEVLEGAFSKLMHGRSCLATGSGTSSLATCLLGAGVQSGDRVLTSALDWTAATEAIRWIGATPVYVDVDPGCAPAYRTDCPSSRTVRKPSERSSTDSRLAPWATRQRSLSGLAS